MQVAVHGRPGRKGNECRMERHAELAETFYDAQKIFARVSFVQKAQDRIIHGLDRADYKKTASIAKRGQVFLIFEQVFDLDGHVVRDSRKFAMKRFDEFYGVTNAVKEIRIAESDVLGAGGHLAPNIF